MPIVLVPAGGTIGVIQGVSFTQSTPVGNTGFSQVAGMVPLRNCDYQDCRDSQQRQCTINPVFGTHGVLTPEQNPKYENDFNSFLVDAPALPQGQVVGIMLQKNENMFYDSSSYTEWDWEDLVSLTDNNNGIYYPPGSITDHPTYTGIAVNWGAVHLNYGPGFYRVKFEIAVVKIKIVITNGVVFPVPQVNTIECAVSEPFHLLNWDCERAHGTVKFESWITGNIGSIDNAGKVFDLCGIDWYDSIRLKGFFGYETTPKYEEDLLEFQDGTLDLVRDKALQEFKFNSNYHPKWLHDRLKTYCLMADTILVSDYNINNSDYFVNRKSVRKAGPYEPVYLDAKTFDRADKWMQRRSKVSVKFREGVESVIKNICCVPKCP